MQFRWWLLNSFSTPYSENWLERRYILGLAIVKGSISKWVFWVINISTFFSYCLHWCWPLVLVWWNFIFKLSVNWPLIISGAQLEKRVLPLLCFMDEDLFTFRFTNRPTGSELTRTKKRFACLAEKTKPTLGKLSLSLRDRFQFARQISICKTDFTTIRLNSKSSAHKILNAVKENDNDENVVRENNDD